MKETTNSNLLSALLLSDVRRVWEIRELSWQVLLLEVVWEVR